MNLKLFNIYGLICLFPLWIFRSNFSFIEIISFFILIVILPFYIHQLFFKNYLEKYSKKIYFWLSLITFYSIDQNLSLWINSNFINYILPINSEHLRVLIFSVITITILNILFFTIKDNLLKILLPFLTVIFVFNLINLNLSYSNFSKVNFQKKNYSEKNKVNKKIVIVFDEMSGFNSLESSANNGDFVNEKIKSFFVKNNFDIYFNARSQFKNTEDSLSTSLNFIKNGDEFIKNKKKNLTSKSNNYFVINELLSNKFFDLESHENIVVQQSMFLNFCVHSKVISCNQFNPYSKDLFFLDGFKDTKLTKYLSFLRNNGSIFGHFLWTFFFELRLVDDVLDPIGEKASSRYIFKQLSDLIRVNKNSNLFFSHFLIPHIPYAYDQNCNFNGSKIIEARKMTINEKRIQHNLEKLCVLKFFEEFLDDIKKFEKLSNFEIIIFSDHDSRIDKNEKENNIIFFHKRINSLRSKIIDDNITLNEILINISSL